MNKQIKTWLMTLGLAAGLALSGSSNAAKPKESAAAPAPAAAVAEAAPAPAPAPTPEAASPAPVAAATAGDAHAGEENPYGLSALWAQRGSNYERPSQATKSIYESFIK